MLSVNFALADRASQARLVGLCALVYFYQDVFGLKPAEFQNETIYFLDLAIISIQKSLLLLAMLLMQMLALMLALISSLLFLQTSLSKFHSCNHKNINYES